MGAFKAPPSGARVCTAEPPHGKHRLLSLTEAVEGELPWVRMFYDVAHRGGGAGKIGEQTGASARVSLGKLLLFLVLAYPENCKNAKKKKIENGVAKTQNF